VVVLHGRFGTGIQVMEQTRFNDLADLNSFIVAYPDGYSRSWADGRGNTPSDREDVDDVNFIERMLSDLSQNFQIDIKRIFIVGHSNGGFMVQRMLLEKSDLFRGGVSVSSQLSVSLVKRFEPKSPVSMLMIAGTKDPLVPYYGGYVRDGGEILSAEDTLERWRKWNGCPESLVQATRNEVEDDTTLDILSYIGCQNNTTVKLYRINGGGHSWPGQDQKIPFVKMGPPTREIDAAKEIVLFFKELGL
jgi:polyhydroxybutyrate depolymerase